MLFSFSSWTKIVLILLLFNVWAFTEWEIMRIHSNEIPLTFPLPFKFEYHWQINMFIYWLVCTLMAGFWHSLFSCRYCSLVEEAKLWPFFMEEAGVVFVLPWLPRQCWRAQIHLFAVQPSSHHGSLGVNQICWESEGVNSLRGTCSSF